MSSGRIVILNGCSSSGKSSLAECLQQRAGGEQFLHLQLDAFRAMEPPGYFSSESKDKWSVRETALCRAINAAAAQFARHGQNVLVDHVLSPIAWRCVLQDLAELDVLLVKVICSLDDAQAREKNRPDRGPGLARSQWDSIHKHRSYDFEVNTSELVPAKGAELFQAWFRTMPVGSALAEMRQSAPSLDHQSPGL